MSEINDWRGSTGDWNPTTWRGGADASGLPHGHGFLVYGNGVVHEGAMDHGRRQGLWVAKEPDGALHSYQCADDVSRNYKVRPSAPLRG